MYSYHYNRDEISTQSVIPKEFEYFLIQNKYIKAIENVRTFWYRYCFTVISAFRSKDNRSVIMPKKHYVNNNIAMSFGKT